MKPTKSSLDLNISNNCIKKCLISIPRSPLWILRGNPPRWNLSREPPYNTIFKTWPKSRRSHRKILQKRSNSTHWLMPLSTNTSRLHGVISLFSQYCLKSLSPIRFPKSNQIWCVKMIAKNLRMIKISQSKPLLNKRRPKINMMTTENHKLNGVHISLVCSREKKRMTFKKKRRKIKRLWIISNPKPKNLIFTDKSARI